MFNSIEEEEEEEEEPLLIYTAQGSPFRRKKLSVINGSPEQIKGHTWVVTFEVNFLGIFNVGYHQEVAALK